MPAIISAGVCDVSVCGGVCACDVFYADVCGACVCAAGDALVLLCACYELVQDHSALRQIVFSLECAPRHRGNLHQHLPVHPRAHLKTRRRPRRPFVIRSFSAFPVLLLSIPLPSSASAPLLHS